MQHFAQRGAPKWHRKVAESLEQEICFPGKRFFCVMGDVMSFFKAPAFMAMPDCPLSCTVGGIMACEIAFVTATCGEDGMHCSDVLFLCIRHLFITFWCRFYKETPLCSPHPFLTLVQSNRRVVLDCSGVSGRLSGSFASLFRALCVVCVCVYELPQFQTVG